ncbi:hypothetical protein ACFVWP_05100 [Streptomyces sp. NPDC058175]|uniref:hypothetical protein n=1 Tax=Streptomyces sp. NPDC058175 TaxID=3346367 RepID=UPI0036E9131E
MTSTLKCSWSPAAAAVRERGPAAGSSRGGTLPHRPGSGAMVVPAIRDGAPGQLSATAAALRRPGGAVVERLNQGMTVDDVVHDIDYPAELLDVPWMAENHGGVGNGRSHGLESVRRSCCRVSR